ncbi:hypothetical protein GAPWKB11_0470 [Gilliamella apicola]|jgi:hypothetical protein|nr:hypothetical protein GAPWKB11_0470 [Gilliamella apicola]
MLIILNWSEYIKESLGQNIIMKCYPLKNRILAKPIKCF